MTEWVDAGPAAPSEEQEVRVVPYDARPVAVAHVEGQWHAFDDACPHHDCPLADGYVQNTTIECNCHGSVFDVRTGALVQGPAETGIATYPTKEQDGRVLVDLTDPP